MKNLLRISLVLFGFAFFFIFISCAGDEEKPQNFKSLEEAQTALEDSQDEVFSALGELGSAVNLATTFDGSYPGDFNPFKNKRSKAFNKKHAPLSFGYSPQSGYWTFDTTSTEQGLTFSLNGKIRFTPHDVLTGLPNETTNKMEYDVAASLGESVDGSFISLNYDAGLVVDGIVGYRASTGNATVNGTDNVGFAIDVTLDTDHIMVDYRHKYTITNVIISPTSSYPQSGSFIFTVKRDISGTTGYGENFYVEGSILFDGSNIAVLEFGGFTFHINLDGPYIVEFD